MKYKCEIKEIDGETIMVLPEEVVKELDLHEGDEMEEWVVDGALYLQKVVPSSSKDT